MPPSCLSGVASHIPRKSLVSFSASFAVSVRELLLQISCRSLSHRLFSVLLPFSFQFVLSVSFTLVTKHHAVVCSCFAAYSLAMCLCVYVRLGVSLVCRVLHEYRSIHWVPASLSDFFALSLSLPLFTLTCTKHRVFMLTQLFACFGIRLLCCSMYCWHCVQHPYQSCLVLFCFLFHINLVSSHYIYVRRTFSRCGPSGLVVSLSLGSLLLSLQMAIILLAEKQQQT